MRLIYDAELETAILILREVDLEEIAETYVVQFESRERGVDLVDARWLVDFDRKGRLVAVEVPALVLPAELVLEAQPATAPQRPARRSSVRAAPTVEGYRQWNALFDALARAIEAELDNFLVMERRDDLRGDFVSLLAGEAAEAVMDAFEVNPRDIRAGSSGS